MKKLTANDYLARASMASAIFNELDQKHVDRIVEAVFKAGFNNRVKLAKMAAEETGMGIWQHKVIKNVVATQLVYDSIKDEKTVGIIDEDKSTGIISLAQPIGPIFALTPVTNPTSTIMFKILISLKARNPIIISPHKKSVKCCRETIRICYKAALAADAPEDCIQMVTDSSREMTNAIMKHHRTALILGTGGTSLVKAAYSSGTPAIGVGAGNVPVLIDSTADIPFAVANVIASKTFDNGTICASEQAIVVEKSIAKKVKDEFTKQNCYFLSASEIKKLEKIAINPETKSMSAAIVGQSVKKIAKLASLKVPTNTKILLAPLNNVGNNHPLSGEILAPILAFYVTDGFARAVKLCIDLNHRGGLGHTASIYSNSDSNILHYAELMDAGRIVVNTPSSQGAVGGIFNKISPSLTLGCGSGGKNITTENITAKHLFNIKKVCRRHNNEQFLSYPTTKYLDETNKADQVIKEYNKNH